MKYITDKVLMIRPACFGYNPQTAASNAFQKQVDLSGEEIQRRALREFDEMAEQLTGLGVEVLIFEDTKEPHTPDSIFPNNWFSTHPDGTLCLYPMEAEARRFERNVETISGIKQNFDAVRTLDFSHFEKTGKFLEGTGSLVLDHKNKIAYASISSRTNEQILDNWAAALDFEVVKFHSFDAQNTPIYHTNVMMCVGDNFSVICLESISDKIERQSVVRTLRDGGYEIIEISFSQMLDFAGNMLLLQNKLGEKILVMSRRAFGSLSKEQITRLESHSRLSPFDIDIIEKCGGGSVRCMIAEIFHN